MITNCPVCGKLTCIHWPEHWVYRRGQTYYCSAMCMDVDIVRDMNLLKQVRADRKKRKEAKKMEKMKKDGTPAKKPGPKPKPKTLMEELAADGALLVGAEYEQPPRPKKAEIPEPVTGDEWEKMETPEKPKAPVKTYKVTGIRVENFGEFYYDQKFNSIDWRTEEGDEISLPPIGWKNLMQEMPDILKALGVKL